ncbi:hypothetical protein GCM10027174_24080 [Salinifilum aidingensis]
MASVDGLRFVVPPASVRTGANPRYFGQRNKGVTWLNYINDHVAGLGGLVVAGTVRDSLHVLDGLLDLDGGPRPEMVTTDTASYSDQIFGLYALLGYQFSPRLADMPEQKFWSADPTADYGPLNALVPDPRHALDLELIRRNWPDLLRVAGSLATGAMKASELMRITQGGGSPTTRGKALVEYGHITKTRHMLAFVDADETYRRRIHTQLNTQESRHALARRIFHGKRGQLYQPYRQGQEDQLGALGLVLNMVCSGTASTSTPSSSTSAARAIPSATKTWSACPRWAGTTSTCKAATPSPAAHPASSARCPIPAPPTTNSEPLYGGNPYARVAGVRPMSAVLRPHAL